LKAAVYRGPYNVKIEEIPESKITGRRVLVNFMSGSICGTDMHFYRGEWKTKKRKNFGS